MTSVGKGGAEGLAKGLPPAHFFPLEGTALDNFVATARMKTSSCNWFTKTQISRWQSDIVAYLSRYSVPLLQVSYFKYR